MHNATSLGTTMHLKDLDRRSFFCPVALAGARGSSSVPQGIVGWLGRRSDGIGRLASM
jgi:hypothetical protein